MAVDMFLKIEGIKGESKDAKHAGETQILAWSWGMSNSGTAHMGGGAGAGKVNVQDISITKYIDSGTPDLMLAACNGKHFKTATLVVRKAGEKPLEYLTIKMEDLMVTAVSTGGSGGEDRLTENVTLNFANVKLIYKAQKADGSGDADITFGWKIAANVKY